MTAVVFFHRLLPKLSIRGKLFLIVERNAKAGGANIFFFHEGLTAGTRSFRTQNGSNVKSGNATTGGPDTRRRDERDEQNQSCGRSKADWLRPSDQVFQKAPRKLRSGYSGNCAGYNRQQRLPQ